MTGQGRRATWTVEQGYEAARLTGLSIFASLKQELGDLDRVTSWVKALGLVHCAPASARRPAVINGFTDLVLEVWGEAGRHARSAIGAAAAPLRRPGRGRGDRRDTPGGLSRNGRVCSCGQPIRAEHLRDPLVAGPVLERLPEALEAVGRIAELGPCGGSTRG